MQREAPREIKHIGHVRDMHVHVILQLRDVDLVHKKAFHPVRLVA